MRIVAKGFLALQDDHRYRAGSGFVEGFAIRWEALNDGASRLQRYRMLSFDLLQRWTAIVKTTVIATKRE